MGTLRAILTSAVLLAAVTATADAADLYSASLQASSSSSGHFCAAVNKGTGVVTMSFEIIAPFLGIVETCGPFHVEPGTVAACYDQLAAYYAYCHLKTSNSSNTLGSFMVLDGDAPGHSFFETLAAVELK